VFRKGTKYCITLILITLIVSLAMPVGTGIDSEKVLASGWADDPDLLIIAPEEFSEELAPLVIHKRNTGMPTAIESLENIYLRYPVGDAPEKIKRAIKDYYDDYHIKYVMLVGDCNKFPIRWQRGHLIDSLISDDDPDIVFTASDFYYADLRSESSFFNDWDADGDGYYGEIFKNYLNPDDIDPIPEVNVGRVPAADEAQVTTYVNKVIFYESNTHYSDWFKNVLLIQKEWTEDIDAQENIAGCLEPLGFNTTRLYEDIDPADYPGPIDGIPSPVTISTEINSGYGFVSHLYHGGSRDWDDLFTMDDVAALTNNPMLPVIYSGACDTAKFYGSTLPYRPYRDINLMPVEAVDIGEVGSTEFPQPHPIQPDIDVLAISESFLFSSPNGAIAYFGSQDTGEPGYHKVLDEAFFKAYSLGYNVLGDMWKYAIKEFADVFDLKNLTADGTWRPVCKMHTPSRFILLGDPSLRVGGIDWLANPPGTEWGVMFGENAAGRDIIRMDEGYTVAGYGWDPGEYAFDYWGLMASVDIDGGLLDSADFDEEKANVAYSLIYDDAAERYLVTGGKYHHYDEGGHEYEHYAVWLMSANGTLDYQWDTTYGDPFQDWGNSVTQDGDGYLIGGWNGISTLSDQGYSYVIRSEANGSVDWELGRNTDGTTLWLGMSEVYSIETTSDGACLLGTASGIVKFMLDDPPTEASLLWRSGSGEYFAAKETSDGGYIGVGRREFPSMLGGNRDGLILTKLDHTGAETWTHNFGNQRPIVGSTGLDDVGYDVIEVSDGYVITGMTRSWGYHGGGDLWVIKTDLSGTLEWDLVLGGEGFDEGRAIVPGLNGGYIIAGRVGDEGTSRIWTLKVPENFTKPVASFTYSPPSPIFVEHQIDFDASLSHDDDGYPVTYKWDFGDGTTGGGVSPSHTYRAPGIYNVTLYVLDNDGCIGSSTLSITIKALEKQWEAVYGDARDWGHDIVAAPDGGYVVVGNNSITTNADVWAFKTDSRGNEVWNRRYPGAYGQTDSARCVTTAHDPDGGYIAAGFRQKVVSPADREIWIMKLSEDTGDKVWEKFYDYGTGIDEAYDIRWDGDGYIVTGLATAADPARFYDVLLLRIDADGDEVWHEMYPDPGGEHTCGYSVAPTSDGGYIITGGYGYNNNCDAPFLTIKVKADHSDDWRRTTGADDVKSSGMWVGETPDGYIAAGTLDSDPCLIKYFPSGFVDWYETWNPGWDDYVGDAATTADGGYIIAGRKDLWTDEVVYLVRTDAEGNLLWDWESEEGTPGEEGQSVVANPDGSFVVLAVRYDIVGSTYLLKLGPNSVPNASFDYSPTSPESGEPVNFDASDSFDEDGTIDHYLWEFDDGDDDTDATGATPSYTFPANGVYEVTLTVVDNDGGVDTATDTINVTEGFSINFSANTTSGKAPLSVGFTSSVTGGTAPYTYNWDLDGDGSIDSTVDYPTWTYTDPGVYTVSLEATDNTSETKTETKTNYITATGIKTNESSITITTANVSEDPWSDPAYDPTGAPEGIVWATAKGFELAASGPDGTYPFQITFETEIAHGLALYKLPDWAPIPYTILDSHTIEVILDIVGGELDPPFVLGTDVFPPTMLPIIEPQGQFFTNANPPFLSNFGFNDETALDDGWYQIDSIHGAWKIIFADCAGTSWDSAPWPWSIPVFNNLPDGSHVIYFKASDDAGNVEGENGEWSWQFNKGDDPGGGGGGGGGGGRGVTTVVIYLDPNGKLGAEVIAPSSDLRGYLTLPAGTYLSIGEGGIFYWISFIALEEDESVPEPPENATEVIPYYEILPESARFNPPITMTYKYTNAEIPEGADEKDLTIMWYDPISEQWTALATEVDAVNNRATAFIEHLSLYTMMLAPSPAKFEVSSLSITPTETDINGEVTVSVLVTNTGDLLGDCTIACKINGETAAEQSVTVEAGDSQDVVFNVSQAVAGTYTIDVNGLTGQFNVVAPPEPEPTTEPEPAPEPEPEAFQEPETVPAEPEVTQEPAQPTAPVDEDLEKAGVSMPWWTYVIIIAAIIVLGAGICLIIKRRKTAKTEAS
jgi:PKD repeat protein